jgi:adenylylsulfate kinase-like enzyme
MILVLFGQPNSGKTTLADEIMKIRYTSIHIDGDKLREIFVNKDYSKEGRIKNLNRASDIATFMNHIGDDVIMSLVYPYKETRDYLNLLNKDIYWVYLTYEEERGREGFHVGDFEEPTDEKVLHLNTTKETMTECINKIIKYAKLLG